ncbi:MAG: hypothetical protein WBB29_01795 [Geitlerinemataceae cyanobacterium]
MCRVRSQPVMLPQVQLLPGAIAEILVSVADTGSLTLNDRYGLMAAVLDEDLAEEDRRSTNRLIRSVLRGRVEIVDRFPVAV